MIGVDFQKQKPSFDLERFQFGDAKLVLVAVGQGIVHAPALGEAFVIRAALVDGFRFVLSGEAGGTGGAYGDTGEGFFQKRAARFGGVFINDHEVGRG